MCVCLRVSICVYVSDYIYVDVCTYVRGVHVRTDDVRMCVRKFLGFAYSASRYPDARGIKEA